MSSNRTLLEVLRRHRTEREMQEFCDKIFIFFIGFTTGIMSGYIIFR